MAGFTLFAGMIGRGRVSTAARGNFNKFEGGIVTRVMP
jgi:hypothetical protein